MPSPYKCRTGSSIFLFLGLLEHFKILFQTFFRRDIHSSLLNIGFSKFLREKLLQNAGLATSNNYNVTFECWGTRSFENWANLTACCCFWINAECLKSIINGIPPVARSRGEMQSSLWFSKSAFNWLRTQKKTHACGGNLTLAFSGRDDCLAVLL